MNALYHQGFLGLKSLYHNSIESQVSEFIVRINERNNLAAKTTLMRLTDAQLDFNSNISLFCQEKTFSKNIILR
jgi:hypothetical protein